ncbi:hypothetical protein [Paracoccus albus]|uniref:hypothetical protein n=1 Tax=Paracoccus albus TaxID=3017784 RepID=UPI0022F0962F|nr:hypothetical protein [Paracoccus albus]WBU61198.1 hypothetical protein PAF20_04595 [Paracoccus albus]
MTESKVDSKSRPKRKKFKTIAYRNFNFHAVMREILDEDMGSINHLHEVYFSALSAWVVAPHDHELRHDAVRMRMRLILAKHERSVLKAEGDRRSEVDAELRSGKLRNFLNKVYYPLGGIKNLNSDSHLSRTSEYIVRNYQNDIQNFLKFFQVMHYVKTAGLKDSSYDISLRRTYEVLKKFESEKNNNNSCGELSNSEGMGFKYLGKNSLERKLSEYGGNVVLWYAASLVECSEGSLLDAFKKISTKGLRDEEIMRNKLSEWLEVSSHLSTEILNSVESKYLKEAEKYKEIEITVQNIRVPKPDLLKWEKEIIEDVHKIGTQI